MRCDLESVGVTILPHSTSTRDRRVIRLLPFEFSTDMTKANARTIACAIIVEISLPDVVYVWAAAKRVVPIYELECVDKATWGDVFKDGTTTRYFEQQIRALEVPRGAIPPDCYLKQLQNRYPRTSALHALEIQEMGPSILDQAGIDLSLPGRTTYERFLLFFHRARPTFTNVGAVLGLVYTHPFFAVSDTDKNRALCEHGHTMAELMEDGIFPCGHSGNGGYTAYPCGDEGAD